MGRSPSASKEGPSRGAWTAMEDKILSEYIRIHGDSGWRNIPKRAGLKRCGKSCRLRWLNYLRLDIKRGNISPDEEELIIRLHRLLGNRWSLIAGRLPGRTDNEIKNYWNTHISKKLRLSMNESQHTTLQNFGTSSKSPVAVQNPVFKAKALTAFRQSEIVGPNGHNGDGCSNGTSDEALKLCKVEETTKSSWHDLLVNDSIGDEESEHIAADNAVETTAINSTSYMSSSADQQSPVYSHFAGDAATLAESLLYLNELSSPECNLHSPSDCSRDFASEEFYRGLEEIYDNAQNSDWIPEFHYLS